MTARRIDQQARSIVLPDGARALVVDYIVPEDAPADVREGLARRSLVNGGGECPCGAQLQLPSRAQRRRAQRSGKTLQLIADHEPDCVAITPLLLPRIKAWLA